MTHLTRFSICGGYMRPRPCLITRMHVLLCTTCYSHIYESSASMGSKSAQKMRSSTNSTSPPLVPPRHHIPACKRTLPPVSKPGLDFSALSQSEPEMDLHIRMLICIGTCNICTPASLFSAPSDLVKTCTSRERSTGYQFVIQSGHSSK